MLRDSEACEFCGHLMVWHATTDRVPKMNERRKYVCGDCDECERERIK